MPGTASNRCAEVSFDLIARAISQHLHLLQLERAGILVVKPSRSCRMRNFVPPATSHHLVRNGFSLVEMMVVLMIMGLLATVAVLTIPGDAGKLRNEAERFAARTQAARDEAIVGARPIALIVSNAGYYFERRSEGRWQALPGKGFDLAAWDDQTEVSAGRQRVIFDSLGLASSDAAVSFARGDQRLVVHLRRDGKVTLDAQ